VTEQVVRDCAEARIESVWMHAGVGRGAASQAAVAFCRDHGIRVVAGECPYMFLSGAGLVHRVHGVLRKITRRRATPAGGPAAA
jgi:hypothetical protein